MLFLPKEVERITGKPLNDSMQGVLQSAGHEAQQLWWKPACGQVRRGL